jgi:hypothetical protein
MLQSLGKATWAILIVIALVVAGVIVERSLRCHGSPLTREEALQRAAARLARYAKAFDIGDAPAVLLKEEQESGGWIFTYRTAKCDVMVTVDRCHGDDIGGSSGCKSR